MNLRLAVALTAATLAVANCGPPPDHQDDDTIRVFAASSLTAVFTQLGEEFEAANPGVDVEFVFAGSADLATQITEGAPADVFASASHAHMSAVRSQVSEPVVFATNTLTIAVATGNPRGIVSVTDLANPDISTVVCAPHVPCGTAAVEIAVAFGISIPAVSEESSVTDVLGKVASGQADAGLVYVTDIARAQGVEMVAIDANGAGGTSYPIAALTDSRNAAGAQAFVDYVLSSGQSTLAAHGFGAP